MEYREAMFFGLDFRQMVCSLLAVAAAVGIYFSMRRVAGDEVTGWLCMLGAAPFAFCGFFRYHGMTAEQFAWAFIKSEFLYPKRLLFQPEDIYYQCMEEKISDGENGKHKGKEKEKRAKRNKKSRADRNQSKKNSNCRPIKKKRKNQSRKQLENGRADRRNRSREKTQIMDVRSYQSDNRQRNFTDNVRKKHQVNRPENATDAMRRIHPDNRSGNQPVQRIHSARRQGNRIETERKDRKSVV